MIHSTHGNLSSSYSGQKFTSKTNTSFATLGAIQNLTMWKELFFFSGSNFLLELRRCRWRNPSNSSKDARGRWHRVRVWVSQPWWSTCPPNSPENNAQPSPWWWIRSCPACNSSHIGILKWFWAIMNFGTALLLWSLYKRRSGSTIKLTKRPTEPRRRAQSHILAPGETILKLRQLRLQSWDQDVTRVWTASLESSVPSRSAKARRYIRMKFFVEISHCVWHQLRLICHYCCTITVSLNPEFLDKIVWRRN